jgi:glycosyltransferase involved in cell wall biosynthesis
VSVRSARSASSSPPAVPRSAALKSRPRILLIADVPDWIFARHCQMLGRILGDEFAFTVQYMGQPIHESEHDLIYPLEFNLVPPEQITQPSKWVTGIRSHTSWQERDWPGLVQLLGGAFQRVHAVSKRLHHIFKLFLPSLDYLTHGVDTDFFTARTRADQSGRRLRLGWAGSRLNPTKGVNEFIAPLARLPGVEFVFCGHLDDNLGAEGVRDFYDSLDAYVCASEFEGNNNSLLEAAAMQRAIITTDNGTVPEYLCRGESALIVDRGLSDFTCAVLELRDNPAKRMAMGEKARAAVRAKFEWRTRAEDYRAFFRAALANSAAGCPTERRLSWKPQASSGCN